MRSQGGVKFPTGGDGNPRCTSPRAPGLALASRGQQIRCESEADGESPDERDRGVISSSRELLPHFALGFGNEPLREPHESDSHFTHPFNAACCYPFAWHARRLYPVVLA